MKATGIAALFADYRRNVLPREAPPIQVLECRRAFYAAAYAMILNLAYNLGDESTPEEDAIAQLEKLRDECEAFAKADSLPLPRPQLGEVDEPPNYQVDNPEIQATLKELGHAIGDKIPDGWGFTLLLFTYGEGGSLFYISSAQRSDVLNVMKEFIRRQTQ